MSNFRRLGAKFPNRAKPILLNPHPLQLVTKRVLEYFIIRQSDSKHRPCYELRVTWKRQVFPPMRFSGLMLRRKPGITGSRATPIQDWKILAISTDDPMASQLCLGDKKEPGCQASNFPTVPTRNCEKTRSGGNNLKKVPRIPSAWNSPMASLGHFLSHESHGGPMPQVQRE